MLRLVGSPSMRPEVSVHQEPRPVEEEVRDAVRARPEAREANIRDPLQHRQRVSARAILHPHSLNARENISEAGRRAPGHILWRHEPSQTLLPPRVEPAVVDRCGGARCTLHGYLREVLSLPADRKRGIAPRLRCEIDWERGGPKADRLYLDCVRAGGNVRDAECAVGVRARSPGRSEYSEGGIADGPSLAAEQLTLQRGGPGEYAHDRWRVGEHSLASGAVSPAHGEVDSANQTRLRQERNRAAHVSAELRMHFERHIGRRAAEEVDALGTGLGDGADPVSVRLAARDGELRPERADSGIREYGCVVHVADVSDDDAGVVGARCRAHVRVCDGRTWCGERDSRLAAPGDIDGYERRGQLE